MDTQQSQKTSELLSLTPEKFECPVLAVSYAANTSRVLAHSMLQAVRLHTETLWLHLLYKQECWLKHAVQETS